MDQEYYNILGVEKSADGGEIKKAYRKMAMKYHPDKNPGDKQAEDKFKEAAEAYEVLSNPEKRARYDQFGKAGMGGQGFSGQGFGDMNDIFSAFGDIFGDFFGGGTRGGRGRSRARRGADLRYRLEVKLEDVLSGTSKDIEFDTEQSCDSCEGSGAKRGTEPETCETCGGQGQVVRQQGFFHMQTACPSCHGQGRIIKDPCGSCNGEGRELKSRKLKINVPAGVDNGTQLRLSDEGEGGYRGGPAGDLYVEIAVKPHKLFERHDTDLLSTLEVSYTQALLGTELEVETLEGQEKLNLPAGSATGELVKLKGQGMPSIRGGRRGDIVYSVRVLMPKKLKKQEEKLLREIAELRGEDVKKKGLF